MIEMNPFRDALAGSSSVCRSREALGMAISSVASSAILLHVTSCAAG
jgi:hypothetical protein